MCVWYYPHFLKVCELSLKSKAPKTAFGFRFLGSTTFHNWPLNWIYIRESPRMLSADTPWVDVGNRRFFVGAGQNTRFPKNLNGLTGCGQR